MVFAHIPAGYVLAHILVKRNRWPKILLWVGMLGGTFPDIDILYGQYIAKDFAGHRLYLTHFPSVWILIAAIVLTITILADRRDWMRAWAVFFSAAFLHIVLDWVVGDIFIFAPFSWKIFNLIPPPPGQYGWWLLNHITNPAFFLEIAIVITAAIIFFRGGYKDLFGAE